MKPEGTFIAMVLTLVMSGTVQAHGGGLNKEGCHNDRRTGDYHCHRGGPAPRGGHPPTNAFAPAGLAPSRYSPATGAFRNCTEARAAGAAPVRRGDPGYGPHLDRDNDGVGCEPYRGRR